MADVPTIALPGGQKMPVIGFGTWSVWKDSVEDVYKSVKCALESGYRHIDCAYVYNNEEAVGKALKEKFDDGSLKREDLFITTKVWNTYHGTERPLISLKKSLEWLGLDYVDLYLIHWPHAFQAGDVQFPKHEDGKIIFDTTTSLEDTWKGMEICYDEGLAKNLGFSDFNKVQTDRILKVARIKPCSMQVELHLYHSNPALREHCAANGITVTAYAPLGAPNRPWASKSDPNLLEDPLLKKIAAAKSKTVAQVALRYLIQLGLVVIPKSITPKRIVENFQVFDFTLTDDEMEQLKAANKDFRAYTENIALGHPEYPFHVTY